MFYYYHHIGDFSKATPHLDDHQLATYLRLIWLYYTKEKPIQLEIEDVAFAMRSDEKTVRLLLRHYFTETPDGWTHSRCDKEIADFHIKSEAARAAAKARWSNASAMPEQCERNANASKTDASIGNLDANQEPITNNHNTKREQSRGTRLPIDFLLPNDWIIFCQQRRPELDPTEIFEGFRDYWISQPGQKGVKTDWLATWRNWIRRQEVAKKTASDDRRSFMATVTRGRATTKAAFWAQPETIEVQNEPKRIL